MCTENATFQKRDGTVWHENLCLLMDLDKPLLKQADSRYKQCLIRIPCVNRKFNNIMIYRLPVHKIFIIDIQKHECNPVYNERKENIEYKSWKRPIATQTIKKKKNENSFDLFHTSKLGHRALSWSTIYMKEYLRTFGVLILTIKSI